MMTFGVAAAVMPGGPPPPQPSAPYRFFRLYATATAASPPGNGNWGLAELVLVQTTTGIQYPTSAMTTNTTPSPLVASASNEAVGAAYQAFDQNASTAWVTNASSTGPAWLKLDLGPGNAISIASYRIRARSASASITPISFELQGSNTGAFAGEEEVIDSQSGLSWTAGELKIFSL